MNFKEMTLLQLKAYAKEKGIRGVSTLKKNQLIERIIASENKSIQTKAGEGIKTEGEPKAEKRVKTEENSKSEDNIRKTQQKPQESEKKEKVHHHNDRENGKSVKIISCRANLYMNVLNKNNGVLDLPFYGNFGNKGENIVIDYIKDAENAKILIQKDDKIPWQESYKIRNYIKENLKFEGEIEDFLIYSK